MEIKALPSPPYMKFYVDDWLASPAVDAMDHEQRGWYLHLLLRQWQEGALPSDDEKIRKKLKISPKKFQKKFPQVKNCFKIFGSSGEFMANERTLAIYQEMQESSQKRADAGAASGAARRRNKTNNVQALLEHSSNNVPHPDPDPDPDIYSFVVNDLERRNRVGPGTDGSDNDSKHSTQTAKSGKAVSHE